MPQQKRKQAPRTKHEADLAHLNKNPTQYTDGSLGVNMPLDMPVYVRAHRLMQDTEDHNPKRKQYSRALKGHTLEIDCFTFGVKLFVRLGRDGTLKVFAEDSDGTAKLEEWSA